MAVSFRSSKPPGGFEQIFKPNITREVAIYQIAPVAVFIAHDESVRSELAALSRRMRYKEQPEQASMLLEHIDDRASDSIFMEKIRKAFAAQTELRGSLIGKPFIPISDYYIRQLIITLIFALPHVHSNFVEVSA